jgi:hypothetical protein
MHSDPTSLDPTNPSHSREDALLVTLAGDARRFLIIMRLLGRSNPISRGCMVAWGAACRGPGSAWHPRPSWTKAGMDKDWSLCRRPPPPRPAPGRRSCCCRPCSARHHACCTARTALAGVCPSRTSCQPSRRPWQRAASQRCARWCTASGPCVRLLLTCLPCRARAPPALGPRSSWPSIRLPACPSETALLHASERAPQLPITKEPAEWWEGEGTMEGAWLALRTSTHGCGHAGGASRLRSWRCCGRAPSLLRPASAAAFGRRGRACTSTSWPPLSVRAPNLPRLPSELMAGPVDGEPRHRCAGTGCIVVAWMHGRPRRARPGGWDFSQGCSLRW